jgi:hypothetical protein
LVAEEEDEEDNERLLLGPSAPTSAPPAVSPFTSGPSAQPLQDLVCCLMESLGTYVDPLVGLVLLTSAAMAGCGMRQLQEGGGRPSKAGRAEPPQGPAPEASGSVASAHSVHVGLVGEGEDPTPLRLLRGAASLLCPQSLSVATGAARWPEPSLIQPSVERVGGLAQAHLSAASGAALLRSSCLTAAASGVLVLDAKALGEPGVPGAKARVGQLKVRPVRASQQCVRWVGVEDWR